jgi:hypothetical protein
MAKPRKDLKDQLSPVEHYENALKMFREVHQEILDGARPTTKDFEMALQVVIAQSLMGLLAAQIQKEA